MASHGTAFNDAVIEVLLPCAGCNFSYLNPNKDNKSFRILKNIIAFFNLVQCMKRALYFVMDKIVLSSDRFNNGDRG